MAEYLGKQQDVGFVLHSKTVDAATSILIDDSNAGVSPFTHEPDYGGATPVGMFGILAIPNSIKPNSGTTVGEVQYTSADSVFQEVDRLVINNNGALPTVDFEAYATIGVLKGLAILAFQNVDAVVAHSTNFVPSDAVIDFADDEGYVGTVFGKTIAGDGFQLSGAVINTLTISVANNGTADARLMKVSGQFIGKHMETGLTITSTFGSDTNGASSLESYIYNNGDSSYDGFAFTLGVSGLANTPFRDFCWRNFSMTINNNIASDCFTTAGEANNLKRVNPTITWSVDIPHNDEVSELLKSFDDGDTITLQLVNSYMATANKYLKLYCGSGKLTAPTTASEGDYQSHTLQVTQFRPAAGWGTDYVVSLYDTNDQELSGLI